MQCRYSKLATFVSHVTNSTDVGSGRSETCRDMIDGRCETRRLSFAKASLCVFRTKRQRETTTTTTKLSLRTHTHTHIGGKCKSHLARAATGRTFVATMPPFPEDFPFRFTELGKTCPVSRKGEKRKHTRKQRGRWGGDGPTDKLTGCRKRKDKLFLSVTGCKVVYMQGKREDHNLQNNFLFTVRVI